MLRTRVYTALVLVPLMLAGIYLLPSLPFAIFIAAIMALGAWEWSNLAGLSSSRPAFVFGLLLACALLYFTASGYWLVLVLAVLWWAMALGMICIYPRVKLWQSRWMRAVMGAMVLLPMWVALRMLHGHEQGLLLLTLLMLFVWGADIGAYFAGRAWGRAKLAPHVSPGKTWAGALGGAAMALVISLLAGGWLSQNQDWSMLAWLLWLLGAQLLVVSSIVGDLFESMLKRFRGIKDSSQLLPGHGGVMDRIDSLTAAAPIFAFWLGLWPVLVGGL